jgi:basic membrane lipoprotein Med (substrate-binding protein (PBP1-ABC) superfamily)/DNA-binding SARP family transcriptional activator
MEFRILGALEVAHAGASIELGPPKQRALLAVLLLHVGEVVSVDRLVDSLWPDGGPRTAAHSIQIYVSELRKALRQHSDRDTIITKAPGYALIVDPVEVDARRFEQLIDVAADHSQRRDDASASAALREAIGLWRGPALADFLYDEFAQPHIRRLFVRHLDALERLAEAELTLGRPQEALGAAETAIAEEPAREGARAIAMRALYRLGRQPEALRVYEHLRRHLRDELGLEPSPWLQRIQESILLHDPQLGHPVPDQLVLGPPGPNPYKGLRPFEEADAADFFGREALVGELLVRLETGQRLIALVGPSGSGKSSVLSAGFVPRLRHGAIRGSEQWRVVRVVADSSGIAAAEELVSASPLDSSRTVLIVDQLEDAFVADGAAAARLLRVLTVAVTGDADLAVVVALRADFYDRPLNHPGFAAVFVPAVVNVLPLSATELEEAIVRPAGAAGCSVESGLAAELVADTTSQAGALPLVQFALTELFERRTGDRLLLEDFRALGGLRGLLSRQADEVYHGLSDEARAATMQVFLRLVQPHQDRVDVHRRVAVAELLDLEVDVVALSTVLDAFGRHRLLTFDRDEATARATVDVAHEALLREWGRLRGWVEHHRAALRRLASLNAAAEEWEQSGRHDDYLLLGSRLVDHDLPGLGTVIRLTGSERALLEASHHRRDTDAAAAAERERSAARLRRRARSRLVALAVSLVALIVAGGIVVARRGDHTPTVGIVEQDGQFAWIRQLDQGFERAVNERRFVARKVTVTDGAGADDAARTLATQGSNLVVMTALDATMDPIAAAFPHTHFAVMANPSSQPNVTRLVFAVDQGSFLAGVVAASTTRTKTVAVIGGADSEAIWPFVAGFDAGVRAVDPTVRVVTRYLAEGGYDGFSDIPHSTATAEDVFASGADVVFAVAGDANLGVFAAASDATASSVAQRWAIGVDTDQYQTVADDPANVDAPTWRRHILTSVLKQTDVAVHDVVVRFARGESLPPTMVYGLANRGSDISYSGGHIDALRPLVESWRDRILHGAVVVPCVPSDRQAQAAALGLGSDFCST